MGIIARSLGGRLFVNFTTDRFRFTEAEARSLTLQISEDLETIARGFEPDP